MNIRDWKSRIADLGCIIDGCDAPAELHHPRQGRGMSQRAEDDVCIPLCPQHHRLGRGFVNPSVHGEPRNFRMKYGDDIDLIAKTIRKVRQGL